MPQRPEPAASVRLMILAIPALAVCLLLTGCSTPVGADKTPPSIVYRESRGNAISRGRPSPDTLAVLQRFDQQERFAASPDETLSVIHRQAVESRDRSLLFALSELSYLAGERLRRSVKPWEPRDARDYYLASAVYAWFFLFGDATDPPAEAFDLRFRTACDLYNYGLGRALTERRGTNAAVVLGGGIRRLPIGQIEVRFGQDGFSWPAAEHSGFLLADDFSVRGLGLRNRQAGLGAPLIAVATPDPQTGLSRCAPATVFLRLHGTLSDLEPGRCRGSLELYSTFDATAVEVGGKSVPLATDTTAPMAYALNQTLLWRLGRLQFVSFREKIASGVYLPQPHRPGRVPVVFVHGTFSSPVKWVEMVNTLMADPELRSRCEFWQFIYNSGNPTALSAVKLRDTLTEKVRELDPEGKDPALKEMVVIGHSQGGLLAKLTATDIRDVLLSVVFKTNSLEDLHLSPEQEALVRRYGCYDALPFVKRLVFISTPHRGSYLAGSFTRRLARRIISVPSWLVDTSKEFAGLAEKANIPSTFRGALTSLDSMSPRNPVQLKLAQIPPAPGVKCHSIIAVKGRGDFHQGKDGVVAYESAHVDYAASEKIVRGSHSCQDMAETIEEVRRILHEHLQSIDADGGRPQQSNR